MGAYISLIDDERRLPSQLICPCRALNAGSVTSGLQVWEAVIPSTHHHRGGAAAFRPIAITEQPSLNACAVYILLSVAAVCPHCDSYRHRRSSTYDNINTNNILDTFLDRLSTQIRATMVPGSVSSSISSGLASMAAGLNMGNNTKLSYEIHVWEGKSVVPEVRSVALSVATALSAALDAKFIASTNTIWHQIASITRPLLPANHNWLLMSPAAAVEGIGGGGSGSNILPPFDAPALIHSYCGLLSCPPLQRSPFIKTAPHPGLQCGHFPGHFPHGRPFPPGPRGPPVICRLLPRIENNTTAIPAAISPRTMSAALSETSAAVSALAISPRGIARPSPLADQVLLRRYDGGLRSTAPPSNQPSNQLSNQPSNQSSNQLSNQPSNTSQQIVESNLSSDRSSNSSSCGGWGSKVVHRVVLQNIVPPLAIGNLINRSSSQGDNAPMAAPRCWRERSLSPPPSSSSDSSTGALGRTLSSIARFGMISSNSDNGLESNMKKDLEQIPLEDVDLRMWRLARWTALLAERNNPPTTDEDDISSEVQENKAASKLQEFATVCTEVISGCRLFVSGSTVPSQRDLLDKHGITHIFNLAADTCANHFPNDYSYTSILLEDSRYSNEEIQAVICDLLEHIHSILLESAKNRVLVHCREGVSRSASIVIAYMMWKSRLSFDVCLASLRYTRSISNPNTGFTFALLRFQKMLQLERGIPSSTYFDQHFDREIDKLPNQIIQLDIAKEGVLAGVDLADSTEAPPIALAERNMMQTIFNDALLKLGIATKQPHVLLLPANVERRVYRFELQNKKSAHYLIALGLSYYDPGQTAKWLPSLPTPLLDPRFCYILRVGTLVWFWVGNEAYHVEFQVHQFVHHYLRQYCRFARITPNQVTPFLVFQGHEPQSLWEALGDLKNPIGYDSKLEPFPGKIYNYWAYVEGAQGTTFDA